MKIVVWVPWIMCAKTGELYSENRTQRKHDKNMTSKCARQEQCFFLTPFTRDGARNCMQNFGRNRSRTAPNRMPVAFSFTLFSHPFWINLFLAEEFCTAFGGIWMLSSSHASNNQTIINTASWIYCTWLLFVMEYGFFVSYLLLTLHRSANFVFHCSNLKYKHPKIAYYLQLLFTTLSLWMWLLSVCVSLHLGKININEIQVLFGANKQKFECVSNTHSHSLSHRWLQFESFPLYMVTLCLHFQSNPFVSVWNKNFQLQVENQLKAKSHSTTNSNRQKPNEELLWNNKLKRSSSCNEHKHWRLHFNPIKWWVINCIP